MSSETPHPDEVEFLTAEEAQYERDEDGNLKPEKEVIDTRNGPRKVLIKPLVPTELVEMEEKFSGPDDLAADAIFEIINDMVLKPEGVEWGDRGRPTATMSLIEVVFGKFSDEQETDELKARVTNELEKRDNGEGNS